MKSKARSFRTQQISFYISDNSTHVIIQVGQNEVIEAEQCFTLEELKEISLYWHLFDSIHDISNDLISLGEKGKIACQDSTGSFELILNINFKNIKTLILPITKIRTETPTNNTCIKELETKLKEHIDTSVQLIHCRLDKLQEQINGIITKLNRRFDVIESKINENKVCNCNKSVIVIRDETTCKAHPVPDGSVSERVLFNRSNGFDQEMVNKQNMVLATEEKASTSFVRGNSRMNSLAKSAIKETKNEPSVKSSRNNKSTSEKMISVSVDYLYFLNEEDNSMIINWISTDKPIKFKLLYHPSIGEDNETEAFKAFYSFSPILILIETLKGIRFGGYTSVGWNKPGEYGEYIKDEEAFLFSLDQNKKYPIKKEQIERAIYCNKNDIACFSFGLGLRNDFMTSQKNWVNLTYYGNGEPNYELNNGITNFTVKSLYVYQLFN